MFKIAALRLIYFYKRFLSILKPRCCRYYPSCSSYAYQSFEKLPPLVAFYKSFFRILRCNAYFEGGFDYPKIHKKSLKPLQAKLNSKLKFLYLPCNKDEFYVLKILKKDSCD